MRFLILGCQRSGTTLLRLLLDSHPDIYCWDETYSYNEIELNNDEKLLTLAGNKPKTVGFKVPVFTELMEEYDFASKYNYRVLFMHRSIYQVVASMLELPDFLIHAVSDIKLWLTDSNRKKAKLFFSKSMMDEIEKSFNIENRTKLAAHYWAYKNSVIKFLKKKMQVKIIYYDELVTRLYLTLNEGLVFLGLDWHDQCFQHYKLQHRETENNLAIGNTEVDRPVDNISIFKHKKILTPFQIKYLTDFNKDYESIYGIT